LVTTNLQPSLNPLTDPLDQLARHIDGAFVVIVRTSGSRIRRRCWLSVAWAERHARRAREARHSVEIYLAELKPIWRLSGWPA
jgi:hypothetical protein